MEWFLGGGYLVLIGFAVWLARRALVVAVEQAGKAEIVRLRGQLDETLQQKQHELDRALQNQRRTFDEALQQKQHDLDHALQNQQSALDEALQQKQHQFEAQIEAMRAEYQLTAEVRRQVAGRKVAALLEIVSAGQFLQRDVLVERDDKAAQKAAWGKVENYVSLVNRSRALFSAQRSEQFGEYATQMLTLRNELYESGDPAYFDRASKLTDGFLELARGELGTTTRETTPRESPEKGER